MTSFAPIPEAPRYTVDSEGRVYGPKGPLLPSTNGVAFQSVYDIVKRRTWAHLD